MDLPTFWPNCSQTHPGSMLWSQFSAIFDDFRWKNWRFSQKPMLWLKLCIIWLYFESKTPISCRIFWRKYFKNHNIGPLVTPVIRDPPTSRWPPSSTATSRGSPSICPSPSKTGSEDVHSCRQTLREEQAPGPAPLARVCRRIFLIFLIFWGFVKRWMLHLPTYILWNKCMLT
jgi:hypothetical protein